MANGYAESKLYIGLMSGTRDLGIEPKWAEAAGFALLAKQTLEHTYPNATDTGPAYILGGVYFS